MGRKKGYKVTKETKQKISDKRKGHEHNIETKNKIAQSLKDFWRRRRFERNEKALALAAEHKNNPEAEEWIKEHMEDIGLALDDVWTDKQIRNRSYTEIPIGQNIDYIQYDLTPETLCILKDLYEQGRLDEYFLDN